MKLHKLLRQSIPSVAWGELSCRVLSFDWLLSLSRSPSLGVKRTWLLTLTCSIMLLGSRFCGSWLSTPGLAGDPWFFWMSDAISIFTYILWRNMITSMMLDFARMPLFYLNFRTLRKLSLFSILKIIDWLFFMNWKGLKNCTHFLSTDGYCCWFCFHIRHIHVSLNPPNVIMLHCSTGDNPRTSDSSNFSIRILKTKDVSCKM